ncbi:DNA helicase PcrA [Actinobacteria bacterium YIM 96077]|uniref:ATP-dependent DNA helicase n=1 Tax=Phytoactinopolyspora halophila TaxID=1981511 RepID=A0A329QLR7_9ACTN|nr:DNA helicase PcrA [Phytoactinopolyspora halophila]AYY15657.1 DNA helicase PcrA [Actinobacteria bacterium YIM 96077]RAW11488.1 DNA helicase PcrA [Phytoactinopolyspora halophila]
MSAPTEQTTLSPATSASPETSSHSGTGEDREERRRTDAASILEGLNAQQREAVTHEGPPLLIVAGAGSGKTRVLTRRIAYLLAERDVHPGSILAITFTNKAAGEMKDRVTELVGRRAGIMWVSTFHSACVRILRREAKRLGFSSSFSIYDQADSQRLMTLVCRDLELDPRRYPPRAFSAAVSNYKNELIDHETAAEQASSHYERQVAEAYALYQQRLASANAFDFDDLIMTTVNLLQAFPEVAEHYRRRFRHILVDEYQDTNHAQYVLIRELVGAPGATAPASGAGSDAGAAAGSVGPASVGPAELCVVGDADQSIYAFRGATIRNIEEFEKDFPNAQVVLLEQNYRSTQTILSAANTMISHNSGRKPKRLWSDGGDGEKIVGYVADDEHAEAQFIAEEIDRLSDEGLATPGDVAVFYRTNAQSRSMEEVLIRVGLPYRVVGGVRFYERREIKDALAYLRFLANPEDTVSLRRILNVPKRGIGERAEAMIDALAQRERITFWQALRQARDAPGIATRSVKAIENFVSLADELRELAAEADPATTLETVLERTGYLAELSESDDPQDETRAENLRELIAVATEYDAEATDEAVDTLTGFLERVSLVADADDIPEGEDHDGVVTLMTLHTAKGLEFPVVFLTGLEDGVFPHQRSLGEQRELEEERRLAYVGITRARERLYLSRAIVRSAWGTPSHNPASRFLLELPDELIDWRRTEEDQARWTRPAPTRGAASTSRPMPALTTGDRVNHDAFGLGKVVATAGSGDQAQVTVDFGAEGLKTLMLRYAPIAKL